MSVENWWEDYFSSGQWENNQGIEQTSYFAKLILDNMPEDVKQYLATASILDWGCALGQAVYMFQSAFPKARVTGLDFSKWAIAKAKLLYPDCSFVPAPLNALYDVILTSNVLEHYPDPLSLIGEHLAHTNKYCIAMVPYNQAGNGPFDGGAHVYSFTEETFPDEIGQFKKIFEKVIPAYKHWAGCQLLVIYEL